MRPEGSINDLSMSVLTPIVTVAMMTGGVRKDIERRVFLLSPITIAP